MLCICVFGCNKQKKNQVPLPPLPTDLTTLPTAPPDFRFMFVKRCVIGLVLSRLYSRLETQNLLEKITGQQPPSPFGGRGLTPTTISTPRIDTQTIYYRF